MQLKKCDSEKLLIIGEKGVIIYEDKDSYRFISSTQYQIRNSILSLEYQKLLLFDEKNIILI
jgi:hypothetical protein